MRYFLFLKQSINMTQGGTIDTELRKKRLLCQRLRDYGLIDCAWENAARSNPLQCTGMMAKDIYIQMHSVLRPVMKMTLTR